MRLLAGLPAGDFDDKVRCGYLEWRTASEDFLRWVSFFCGLEIRCPRISGADASNGKQPAGRLPLLCPYYIASVLRSP